MTNELKEVEVEAKTQFVYPLQPLNSMLTDFSYRTIVEILDFMDGERLFKGTLNKYHQSELKKKEVYVELAEVFDGEFVIKVRAN